VHILIALAGLTLAVILIKRFFLVRKLRIKSGDQSKRGV